MPGLAKLGDATSGHHPFPPQVITTASTNVIVNGIGAVRISDSVSIHCAGTCHPGTVVGGSGTILINGIPAARMGDAIDCGSTIIGGSPNVLGGS